MNIGDPSGWYPLMGENIQKNDSLQSVVIFCCVLSS